MKTSAVRDAHWEFESKARYNVRELFVRLLLLVTVLTGWRCESAAQRAIPDNNLALPVLILMGDGSSGSGFYLNTGEALYLVTAKHVLFNLTSQSLLSTHAVLISYPAHPGDPGQIRLALDLSVLQANGLVKRHPARDVAVIKLFDNLPVRSAPRTDESITRMNSLAGVTIQSWVQPGIVSENLDAIRTFDQVLVGNPVMLFGYPSSLALQTLQQLDPDRPLLRKGIVAGASAQRKTIVLDCPVYFGNSGGPVLEMDTEGLTTHLYVIGIVDQYVPFVQSGGAQTFAMQIATNSGYSIITPMDFVLELVTSN